MVDEDRVSIIDLSTDEIVQTIPLGGLTPSFADQECPTCRIDPCPTLEELRSG